jgi:hypothetical protein
MRAAEEFQRVTDSLSVWQAYEPAVKADLTCCAFQSPGGWILVDPIPLADEALAELPGGKPVAAIVLTNGNHERAAAEYRRKFAAPIFAHLEARGEFTLEADHWVEGGARILDALDVAQIDGAAKGEIALHAGGILMMGDALINLDPHGFAFLPDKYCINAQRMRVSLRKLLQFSFDIMTFAHGLPLVSGEKKRLEQLLQ